jgi:hypothetical protein
MNITVTVVSKNDVLLRLVRDFAHGLGCRVEMVPTPSVGSIRIALNEDEQSLVELLTHVALSAAKAGIDVAEPLCHVTYQHRSVTSQVTLSLRLAEFHIDKVARIGA